MSTKLNSDTWVWVVVQNPGVNEQFLGQHDSDQDVSFIPAFSEKEAAQQCLVHMTTQKGNKYEVQAVIFAELANDAAKHGFMIFMLDSEGRILDRIEP
jgi:hypothetical protein